MKVTKNKLLVTYKNIGLCLYICFHALRCIQFLMSLKTSNLERLVHKETRNFLIYFILLSSLGLWHCFLHQLHRHLLSRFQSNSIRNHGNFLLGDFMSNYWICKPVVKNWFSYSSFSSTKVLELFIPLRAMQLRAVQSAKLMQLLHDVAYFTVGYI